MMAAVAFMLLAALRAQQAYRHRNDAPGVARPYVNSAMRLSAVGVVCFIGAMVLR